MADQPTLEVLGRRFRVELKCKYGFFVAECLVLTNRGRGEEVCSLGKIKSVTMPVEDRHALQALHRALFSSRGKRNRRPSDLFRSPGINSSAQGTRKELRPETNAERRSGKIQALLNHGDLIQQKRIFFFLICSNGTSENHEEVTIRQLRATEVVYSRIAILDAIGATGENGLKGAEVFEGNVSDGRCSFHGKRGAL